MNNGVNNDKIDEAILAFDSCIKINPQDADAWEYKGRALKSAGRTTEAESAYAKARELGYKG